jgi:hypothetical protein
MIEPIVLRTQDGKVYVEGGFPDEACFSAELLAESYPAIIETVVTVRCENESAAYRVTGGNHDGLSYGLVCEKVKP